MQAGCPAVKGSRRDASYSLPARDPRADGEVCLGRFETTPQATGVVNGEYGAIDNPARERDHAVVGRHHRLIRAAREIDPAVSAQPRLRGRVEGAHDGGPRLKWPEPPP